ncbi:Glutaredoxin domain-containing protein [Sphingomonas antarctica]|uniref:glutaredoxin n=1 Tax=Sphingomonas antarctica TaxID=2040274 RepID=UPI0039E9E497
MAKQATLYRMVTPEHICPFGVHAKELLEGAVYDVDDRHLKTREETDSFKAEHNLRTTPLIVIDGKDIGGSDDLERYLADG